MANWLARVRGSVSTVALAGEVFAVLGALSVPAAAAEKEKKPPALSEEIAKKLRPAQEAGNKGDLDACVTQAKDAAAVAVKPHDKETSLNILAWCPGKKGDFPASEEQGDRELSLPMYPEMTEAQVEEVAGALKRILA